MWVYFVAFLGGFSFRAYLARLGEKMHLARLARLNQHLKGDS